MVLVRYRTRGNIELSMKLTTDFTHPSQGARLWELTPYAASVGRQMGFSPVVMCFSKQQTTRKQLVRAHEVTFRNAVMHLSSSLFIRHYWGNPG